MRMTLEVKPTLSCGFCGMSRDAEATRTTEQELVFEGLTKGTLHNPYCVCPRCRQQVDRSTWNSRSWKLKWRREARKGRPLQEFNAVVSFMVSPIDGQKYTKELLELELRQLLRTDKILLAVDVEHVTEVA